MIATIISVLASIVGIGFLIFVHELGHFLMARWNGIRVEVFSLGFGRPIWSLKKGDTTYQIGIFPLGGYCKMAGEEIKDGTTGAADEYFSKPPWRRLLVVFSGPAFNYIFGVLLLSFLFLFPQIHQTLSNRIDVQKTLTLNGAVRESPAYLAGLRTGDLIVSVNGRDIANWTDIKDGIMKDFDTEKSLTIRRGEEVLSFDVLPLLDRDTGMAIIGITPWIAPVISTVRPDSAAEKYGLKDGDTIISVNGVAVQTVNELAQAVEVFPSRSMYVIIDRNGIRIKKPIDLDEKDGHKVLGVEFAPKAMTVREKAHDPFTAVWLGFKKGNDFLVQNSKGLVLLIKGKLNARKSVGGPVKIFTISTQVAKLGGVTGFLSFIALISILLGFFNLLPLPAVDGGYLIVFLIEWISGRKLSMKVVEVIQTVGFFLIIGLLVLVTFNDILSFWIK